MQSIRLLETQQQPVTSRPGSASSKKPYEPWNDIQFSVDGGVASGGNSMSLPVLVGLPGASTDTAAIAPWMTVDPAAQGSATPQAPPRRALFKSSMSKASTSNLSAQQLTPGFLSRHRGGSEASSYTLAANGVNGTPFVVPSDFGDAWHSPSTTSLVRSQGSPAGNDGSSSIGEGRDGKKTLRDRGKDFGRLLKKKASKVGLSKPEGSDDGHSALPIPPLPYPTSVSTTSLGDSFSFSTPPPNPPHSPTQQKEKRWRSLAKLKPLKDKERDNHPAGTYASEITIGEPEITLDTDLNSMEGIIDLNLNRGTRPPHDIKGPAFGSHGTTGTLGSGNTDYGHWDGDPVNSSLGTSEGGGGGGTLSRVNPTFTNPFEMGPSASPTALTGSSRPFNTRQRSNSSGTSPLTPIASSGGGNNNKRSKPPPSLPAPLALGPAPKSAKIPQNVVDPAQPAKDPAWHAPESWDVDKVGPEAEGFSSDEDIGEMSSRLGPIRDVHDPEYDGVIGVSSVQGRRSSLSSSGKPRMKGGTNVFNGIGMIGGIGGGAYGIGYVGYGRLRTRSDAYGGGGGSIASGYARDGMGKDSLTTLRKDSWPDEDMMTRRPSDALSSSTAPRTPLPPFQLRVYRIDGSYHIVECPISTGALDLAHVLRKKLLLPGQHYKLHIRERGRERVLGPQERPINILRRRLEQAGYDESDDLEHLGGEDISFLLRFVFRDANLPTAQPTDEDDVLSGNITSFEHIDLTGRGLLTIPILLHRHAPTIVVLNLSKNPHIDIPLDFIASCTMLRDLRLSQAAMKQVPSRVKHISTLHELDISSNRMVSLDEADLHRIPGLRNIQVQNNRLSSLPKSFAEMKALKFLNISNNKFDTIPPVISQIANLVDLDLSFNTISTFPPNLGDLANMERLVIVGNRIASIPPQIANMVRLKEFDCRRNAITDLSPAFACPALEILRAGNNALHGVELAAGSKIKELSVPENERLSSFVVQALPEGSSPYALETLDLSKCMLSSLGDSGLWQLTKLTSLKFDHNTIRQIPDTLCQLPDLEKLSASNNHLDSLPLAIGRLRKLRALLVHNNNIKTIPASIWLCESLTDLNASSNLVTTWMDPIDDGPADDMDKKSPSLSGKAVPSLTHSLERLYLADNRLDEDVFRPISRLRNLKVLNLSFNDIYELPLIGRLPAFSTIQELYLSGNKLTSLPAEDLHQLQNLRVLFLNANKLQNLPSDLGKVKGLECLDVGGNVLKYNVGNWQFDWNWNFNRELRYLNLSGNKRLEIKHTAHDTPRDGKLPLTGFGELNHLKLLGLMDITLVGEPEVPDETEDRRIRTSDSQVGGMAYGISDTLGKLDTTDKHHNLKLSMFDLVVPSFRGRDSECLFGMFGRHVPIQWGNRPTSNRLAKYLQQQFSVNFAEGLKNLRPGNVEGIGDALRRAFLSLNKGYYGSLRDQKENSGSARKLSVTPPPQPSQLDLRSGSSGLVLYIVDEPDHKVMHVANVGSILAVVSRKGGPMLVSNNHQPFDRTETDRIRAAEGWVSPKGLVNDELEISRSFGVYHLLPAVNARPSVQTVTLTDQDEFVIIGNRGLWDYVAPQTAVDIARLNKNEPMIAAQRLRDYAMSYGAEGSTMIMVIAVKDLFRPKTQKNVVGHKDEIILERTAPRRVENTIGDRTLARLETEIPPPVGFVALVFTDIRNSTSLWEKNPGMPTAMRLHNSLLRRQLREVGGYEVKTEGDAFVNSFPTVGAALLWCFNVQVQLLQEEWPQWILESDDGKEIHDEHGNLLVRGLSVRMGIHWGAPNCEPDPITGRMDYFGTMVNRSARVSASADGGQIMISNDVVREIMAILPMDESETGLLTSIDNQPPPDGNTTAAAIHRMGVVIKEMGEYRLKGLEVPETLSLVYPKELAGRLKLENKNTAAKPPPTRVQFSVDQLRSLAMLAIRIEALASDRVFRSTTMNNRSYSLQSASGALGSPADVDPDIFMHANPDFLIPPIHDSATDADLLQMMDSLTLRIDNALSTMYLKHVGGYHPVLAALEQAMKVDPGMLVQALSMFSSLME